MVVRVSGILNPMDLFELILFKIGTTVNPVII